MHKYKHYIRFDDNNDITKSFSDGFEDSETGDVLVSTTGERHFNLEVLDPIDMSIYKYKYVTSLTDPSTGEDAEKVLFTCEDSGYIVEKTEEELRPLSYLQTEKKNDTNTECKQRILDVYSEDIQRSVAIGANKYTGTGGIEQAVKDHIDTCVSKSDEINDEIDALTTRQEVIDYVIDFDS